MSPLISRYRGAGPVAKPMSFGDATRACVGQRKSEPRWEISRWKVVNWWVDKVNCWIDNCWVFCFCFFV